MLYNKDEKMISLIMIFIGLTYLSMFFSTQVSSIFGFLSMIFLYINILFYKDRDIENIIILTIYSNVIMPSLRSGNNSLSLLLILFLKIIPVILILTKHLFINREVKTNKVIIVVTVYVIYLLYKSVYNLYISVPIIINTIIPLTVFLLFVTFYNTKSITEVTLAKNIKHIIRIGLLLSIITYFMPDYIQKLMNLIESGYIFKEKITVQYYMMQYLPRNAGIAFDPRLLGTYSYLFLFYIIKFRDDKFIFDLITTVFILITSFTRGPIVVSVFILAGHFLLHGKVSSRIMKVYTSFVITVLIIYIGYQFLDYNSPFYKFIQSFNIFNENNVISQRKLLADLAAQQFKNNPLFGNGLGWVSSINNYILKNQMYKVVSDAYYHILLAETGLVGLILFLISYYMVFDAKKRYNLFFYLGFLVQLYGTDIPKSSIIYIGILVIVYFGARLPSINVNKCSSTENNEVYKKAYKKPLNIILK